MTVIPTPPEYSNKLVPDVALLVDNVSKKTYKFPFNVNALSWSYQMNTQSYDTIGGRVTQLLSTRVNTMTVDGEAGSRKNLLALYENFKTIQDNQNLHKVSMTFSVPSRKLKWNVFLQTMQIAWDITTVTYPYTMAFQVDQDLSANAGFKMADALTSHALGMLATGVGFSGQWTGLTSSNISVRFQDLNDAIGNGLFHG